MLIVFSERIKPILRCWTSLEMESKKEAFVKEDASESFARFARLDALYMYNVHSIQICSNIRYRRVHAYVTRIRSNIWKKIPVVENLVSKKVRLCKKEKREREKNIVTRDIAKLYIDPGRSSSRKYGMPSLGIEFEKFNGHVRNTLERIERKKYGTVSISILSSFAVYS